MGLIRPNQKAKANSNGTSTAGRTKMVMMIIIGSTGHVPYQHFSRRKENSFWGRANFSLNHVGISSELFIYFYILWIGSGDVASTFQSAREIHFTVENSLPHQIMKKVTQASIVFSFYFPQNWNPNGKMNRWKWLSTSLAQSVETMSKAPCPML